MSPTRLILHLGAHTTATAALQRVLRENAAALEAQGVSLLPAERLNAAGIVNFLHRPYTRNAETRGRLRAVLEEAAAARPGRSLLVSHESLFSFVGDPASEPIYPTLETAIEGFREVSPFDEVRLVCALREPGAFLNCAYVQNLGVLFSGGFDEFLELVEPERLDWGRVVGALEGAFGAANCRWIPFELMQTRGPAHYLGVFLEQVGVRLDGAELPAVNGNLSMTAARMLQASGMTWRNSKPEQRARLSALLREMFPEEEHGRANFVTPRIANEIAGQLRRTHGPLLRRLPLFDDDVRRLWGC